MQKTDEHHAKSLANALVLLLRDDCRAEATDYEGLTNGTYVQLSTVIQVGLPFGSQSSRTNWRTPLSDLFSLSKLGFVEMHEGLPHLIDVLGARAYLATVLLQYGDRDG